MRTLTTTLLLALIGAAPVALAESLRCGSQLVSLDDRRFEVLQKCGKPAVPRRCRLCPQRRTSGVNTRSKSGYTVLSNGMLSILTFEGSACVPSNGGATARTSR